MPNQQQFSTVQTDGMVMAKTAGTGVKIDLLAPDFGWRDLLGELTTKGSGASNPAWAVFRGTISAYKFGNGTTETWMNFHIPHDYVPGSDMFVHIHWAQNVVDTGGTAGVPGVCQWNWDISYAKGYSTPGGAGNAFPATKTITVTQQGSTTQYAHMIAEVQFTSAGGSATTIDRATIEVDGLILARVYRDSTAAADTLNQDVYAFYCDLHYQSTGRATKNRNPPFDT